MSAERYIMTRRLVCASRNTTKVHLDSSFPFVEGDEAEVTVESMDGTRASSGIRKIYRSGSSLAIVIPRSWGFNMGETVYVTFRRRSGDDA